MPLVPPSPRCLSASLPVSSEAEPLLWGKESWPLWCPRKEVRYGWDHSCQQHSRNGFHSSRSERNLPFPLSTRNFQTMLGSS